MKPLWAVTEGEYSDYHILGLFETEEEARRVAHGDEHVEQMTLYESGEVVRTPFYVASLSGAFGGPKQTDRGPYLHKMVEWPWKPWSSVRPDVIDYGAPDHWFLRVAGPDKQAVRQVFSDHCAQYKAETGGTWPTPDLQWEEGQ